ncbi:MAG: hypothetical protein KZQ72_03675 [Candidatus Thiodiazotropha sp. (ex Cardiolucina cf. quadrata)]|nr:hypothetical protein [Candidatus Thiodiazotropha sp. (ex Cardiolucina cf. quadrata)]
MVYVSERKQCRQFELLELLTSEYECGLVAWRYPESKAYQLLGMPIISNKPPLEPVTTYENSTDSKRTDLIEITSNTFFEIAKNAGNLKRHCDSLALYKPQETEWFACTIGHEGMCLVREDAVIEMLAARGFNATKEAPAWW